jgi:hypothetical protein
MNESTRRRQDSNPGQCRGPNEKPGVEGAATCNLRTGGWRVGGDASRSYMYLLFTGSRRSPLFHLHIRELSARSLQANRGALGRSSLQGLPISWCSVNRVGTSMGEIIADANFISCIYELTNLVLLMLCWQFGMCVFFASACQPSHMQPVHQPACLMQRSFFPACLPPCSLPTCLPTSCPIQAVCQSTHSTDSCVFPSLCLDNYGCSSTYLALLVLLKVDIHLFRQRG